MTRTIVTHPCREILRLCRRRRDAVEDIEDQLRLASDRTLRIERGGSDIGVVRGSVKGTVPPTVDETERLGEVLDVPITTSERFASIQQI